MSDLQEIKFDTDTLIHIGGLPFDLKAGTPVYGLQSNADIAKPEVDRTLASANRQAAGFAAIGGSVD